MNHELSDEIPFDSRLRCLQLPVCEKQLFPIWSRNRKSKCPQVLSTVHINQFDGVVGFPVRLFLLRLFILFLYIAVILPRNTKYGLSNEILVKLPPKSAAFRDESICRLWRLLLSRFFKNHAISVKKYKNRLHLNNFIKRKKPKKFTAI